MLKAALLRMSDVFPAALLTRGQLFHSQGYVLSVRLSDGLIKGRVKGSTNQLHDVHIDLKIWPSHAAQCSCNKRSNCEHAAACLFSLEAREHLKVAKPVIAEQLFQDAADEVISADEVAWYSELTEDKQDFFSYQLGILIDNHSVNLVPLFVDLMNQTQLGMLDNLPDNKLMMLPLSEHKTLKITWGRIKPLVQLLLQYGNQLPRHDASLMINRYQLLLMQEVEQAIRATRARWCATESLQAKLKTLIHVNSLPEVAVPMGLQTDLRDYQHTGFNWLQFLRGCHFAGILADDMGLGKTIQTLAHLLYEKEQGRLKQPSLIIAPTSLVGNWYAEAKRFAPDLKVLVFHGALRHGDKFDDYDVVLSTYGLIQRDKKRFLACRFYYLILDEAQSIKNARTKTTQIVQQLQSEHRLCLTGTPLENHLGELWSLFHFLMPGLLGDNRQFRQLFRTPIEKLGDLEIKSQLIHRVSPFILRRTKNQVAQELPAKTEMVRMLELTGPQRDLYETIRISMEKKVRGAMEKQGLLKSHIVLLDALLKLRQVCCDPRLVALPAASVAHDSSVKLQNLLELLDSLMEEGRSVLVFSQFTSMLQLIEQALKARHYRYLKLTGKTQNRQAVVEAFQAGEAPIFLISLKAGGTGLNLTRADTVIHYDPWWNPAVEDQATDRTHRIGQVNPVFVYKLIGAGTVEEAILAMQAKKRELFTGILSHAFSETFRLTESDIDQFFAPLK